LGDSSQPIVNDQAQSAGLHGLQGDTADASCNLGSMKSIWLEGIYYPA